MNLHGKKVTLHDMSLRLAVKAMHAKRHQISLDESRLRPLSIKRGA